MSNAHYRIKDKTCKFNDNTHTDKMLDCNKDYHHVDKRAFVCVAIYRLAHH
jgi:hypothetical protein